MNREHLFPAHLFTYNPETGSISKGGKLVGKRLGRKFSVRKVDGQMYRVWRVA